MKNNIFVKSIMMALAVAAFGAAAFGQDAKPAETPVPAAQRPVDLRTTVLGQLGLSRDQVQRIRRVNMERKPLMDAAQTRLHEVNRLLDEAIYADQLNETDVQTRLKEAQLAQAEVAKIRFMNEFAVRRILTPDQLVRFRELREKFEQMRESEKNHPPNGQSPVSRPNPANARPFREGKREIKQAARPIRQ